MCKFWLACAIAGWFLPHQLLAAPPQTEIVQWRAVDRLRKAGVKVILDEKDPSKPAIAIEFHGDAENFTRVGELTTVRHVYLSGSGITVDCLDLLMEFKDLKSVRLLDIWTGNPGLERLSKLTQLQELDFAVGWNVTDKGLKELGKLKNLESLSVNQVTLASDAWLAELKGLNKLRKLDVTRMFISDRGVEIICKNHPQLEHLNMWECDITDRCFQHLKKMPKLRFLSVTGADNVTREAVEAFRKERPEVVVVY